jgi:hypothetical protein
MNTTTPKLILAILFVASTANAAPRLLSNDYKTMIYAKHIKVGNTIKVQYDFEVLNNSSNKIYSFIVGEKSVLDNDPVITMPEMDSLNIGFIAPKNWLAENQHMTESYLNKWQWSSNHNVVDTYALQPKVFSKGFSAVVPKRYSTLYESYVALNTSGLNHESVVKLTKGDTIAPTATITNTVAATAAKKGFFTVNVNLVVKDNYDPLPEVVFSAIQDVTTGTVSASPFGSLQYSANIANNIVTGTYPTVFTIAGDAKVAKKYKLTYILTDASDNQSIISTVVTVPKQ